MRYFSPLFLVLLFVQSFGQNRNTYLKDSARINSQRKVIIDLNAKTANTTGRTVNLPFSNIVVNDARFDTNYVAVGTTKYLFGGKGSFQKIDLANGAASSLSAFLNQNPNYGFTSSTSRMVCFLKSLRITQDDSLNKKTNAPEVYNYMNFEVEAYLNKDGISYPALRLDTIAVAFTKKSNSFPLLEELLNTFMRKAASIDTTKIFRRSGYMPAELDKRYQQRFEKPILSAGTLAKGVYKTSREFLSNNPSITEYEFKKDKKATILYTRTGAGDWLPERTAFGFCDGKTIWINVNNIFHPLVRQGNTFEFIADINYSGRRTSGPYGYFPASGSPASIGAAALISAATTGYENYDEGKSVYQLNMETGEYY